MKKVAIGLALVAVAAVVIVIALNTGKPSGPEYITLRSPGGTVQMFRTTKPDTDIVRQFPDGTVCAVMDGPIDAGIAGIRMEFYKVSCDLTDGYVNARYVH